jgi:hypothetical protein
LGTLQIQNYYPIQIQPDRRQQALPVSFDDRRSGIDRRANTRLALDSKLNQDINSVKNIFQDNQNNSKQDLEKEAFYMVPFGRCFYSISDALANHESIKAIGKGFIQLINVKPDSRDIKDATVQVLNKDFKLYEHQKPFSFVHDTPLDDIPFIRKLGNYDKTLFQTKFGRSICIKLGAEAPEFSEEGIKLMGTLSSKIAGRALLRIPVLSLLFLGLLELPTILKAKDHGKQAVKSGINVTSIVSMGAVLGAIGAYAGPIGSLIGLGLGTYYGNKLGNKANKLIFNS